MRINANTNKLSILKQYLLKITTFPVNDLKSPDGLGFIYFKKLHFTIIDCASVKGGGKTTLVLIFALFTASNNNDGD